MLLQSAPSLCTEPQIKIKTTMIFLWRETKSEKKYFLPIFIPQTQTPKRQRSDALLPLKVNPRDIFAWHLCATQNRYGRTLNLGGVKAWTRRSNRLALVPKMKWKTFLDASQAAPGACAVWPWGGTRVTLQSVCLLDHEIKVETKRSAVPPSGLPLGAVDFAS